MSLWWEGTGVFHHRFAQLVKRASNKGRGTTVYPIHTSLMPVPAGDAQSLERDHTDQQQSTWRTGQRNCCQVRKVRKVNALIELKPIRDIRGHQGQQGKLIYVWWYGGERKIRGRVGPLWKEMGDFFYLGFGEGWGIQWHFCLSLHRQVCKPWATLPKLQKGKICTGRMRNHLL